MTGFNMAALVAAIASVTDRRWKIAAWVLATFLTSFGLFLAYKSYQLTRAESDQLAKTCGAVVDARSSFLAVGAQASVRSEPDRSGSRDQLDQDLKKLTEFANRTGDSEIRVAATNARMALNYAFGITPDGDDRLVVLKVCLLSKFFDESEVIAAKCRVQGLPATPPPDAKRGADLFGGLCDGMFQNAM
ncbi:hypothetical protein [Pseudomonas syringae]|jgi:hypothetical protein|uniref:hypothetical protein n=1 Tax=Pseudomonas syringae TaxID=317 RepID=UPI003F86C3A9